VTRHTARSVAGSFRALALSLALGCAGHATPATESAPNASQGFVVSGDPESPRGATWTFRGTVDGTWYDLAGVLFKPAGAGPFPAVILSHGFRGSAGGLASLLAPTMVQWGLVCIAVNYTHSEGVPIGAPGDESDPGATHENILRAHMTYELLRQLGYVDMNRVALHGHSMGAWVSVVLASEYPNDFRAVTTTGGGVRPAIVRRGPAPSPSQVRNIRAPVQMHHGSADETLPLVYDQRLDQLLSDQGVEHQLYIYPGAGHLQVRQTPLVLQRIHEWYAKHGMF
jgi:dienelactone hydrolase